MRKISYRKEFIDYILFNYEFEDRIAVWILNFLKSHPVISKNIIFTSDENITRKLRISVTGTRRPTLVLEKNNTVTADGKVIFHELNMNQEELLHLEFNLTDEDSKYEHVKAIESDLDKDLHAIKRDALEKQIDQALDAQDEHEFLKLTEILKRII